MLKDDGTGYHSPDGILRRTEGAALHVPTERLRMTGAGGRGPRGAVLIRFTQG
jgi:hypothetical protein